MLENCSNLHPENGTAHRPAKIFLLFLLVLAGAVAFLFACTNQNQTVEPASTENISKAAAKMSDTPLGNEEEAEGTFWYQVSDNNRLITATFDQKDGYKWYCTLSDEDAIILEEEMNDTSTWSASLRPTGDKDTESAVYFDCRKEGSSEPICIYILKLRTDSSTLRVIGIEEQPEQ